MASQPVEGVSHDRAVAAARDLHPIYAKGHAFPRWVVRWTETKSYDDLAEETTVFYDAADTSKEQAWALLKHREPCNIGMERFYDEDRMEADFGWRRGLYDKFPGKNIAVYCRTPLRPLDADPREAASCRLLRVLNVIAPALDDPRQPDCPLYVTPDGALRADVYTCALRKIFDKVWACYGHLKARGVAIRRILVPCFGTGAFSGGFEQIQELFATEFARLLLKTRQAQREGGLGVHLVGKGRTTAHIHMSARSKIRHLTHQPRGVHVNSSVVIGDIRTLFQTKGAEWNLDELLLVNAWDPWSIAGNGNAADNSMDGALGSVTAIGCLSWPLTNPRLSPADLVACPAKPDAEAESSSGGPVRFDSTRAPWVLEGDVTVVAKHLVGQPPPARPVVLVHGCNCFCQMGAGLAKQIAKLWPEAYAADKATAKGDAGKLGHATVAEVLHGRLVVANAYTQHTYGSWWTGREPYADYDAIQRVFQRLAHKYGSTHTILYPKIGAGLAGGDWNRIAGIICKELEGCDHALVVLPGGKK